VWQGPSSPWLCETKFVAQEYHVGAQRSSDVTDCLADECVQLVRIDRHAAPSVK
jgi:hypothetical protein